MKKIIIGADFVPDKCNEEYFINGNLKAVFEEKVYEEIKNSDYKIFNFESPFTAKETPLKKWGPNLIAKPSTINGYKELGVNLLTLANNHVYDQGDLGFESTLNTIQSADIDYVGAGNNSSEAKRPFIFKLEDVKFGVYNCCEHEFSVTEFYGNGCNAFDPFESFDDIVTLKKQVDYVIVLYHGGREQYRYPFPYLQKTCRKFAEKGADLVICQHTHCVGCEEDYKGSKLIYGQGNVLFKLLRNEFWNNGILVELLVENGKVKVEYYPYEDNGLGIKSAEDKSIMEGFYYRSKQIRQEGFIEKNFKEYCLTQKDLYIEMVRSKNDTAVFNMITAEPHIAILQEVLYLKGVKKIIK